MMIDAWRQMAVALYNQVIDAGQPDHVVRHALSNINDSAFSAVLAVGKAAYGMAQSAYENGIRVKHENALVIAPSYHCNNVIFNRSDNANQHNWQVIESAHPVPDINSLHAGQKAAALCQSLSENDHLLVLLSGGASSLMVNPQPPLTLADKVMLNERLLTSGGDIHQINAIRRLVSQIKGGRLAAIASPAKITQLIISDVEDDNLSSIGSGILIADPVTLEDSLKLIEILGLSDLPFMPILLERFSQDNMTAPLSPDDPVLLNVDSHIIASNRQLIHSGIITSMFDKAPAEKAKSLPQIINLPRLSGEAQSMANHLAESIKLAAAQSNRSVIGMTGGETVVTLPTDHGLGGRSQELALAFALAMQDANIPWLILAAGTDGRDGPTDAAGAMLDSEMILDRADAEQALLRHDVWNALDRIGGLFRPGASGTNLADMVVIVAG